MINKAIIDRILYYCELKEISINALANKCFLTQSTLENITNGKSKNPKMLTIMRICIGLNITLKDFFDSSIFEKVIDLERGD